VTVPRGLIPLILVAAALAGVAAGGWLFGIIAGG
jgi:hypothetical protein